MLNIPHKLLFRTIVGILAIKHNLAVKVDGVHYVDHLFQGIGLVVLQAGYLLLLGVVAGEEDVMHLVALLVESVGEVKSVLHDVGVDGLGLLADAIEPQVPFVLLAIFDLMMQIPLGQHITNIQIQAIPNQLLQLHNILLHMLFHLINKITLIHP